MSCMFRSMKKKVYPVPRGERFRSGTSVGDGVCVYVSLCWFLNVEQCGWCAAVFLISSHAERHWHTKPLSRHSEKKCLKRYQDGKTERKICNLELIQSEECCVHYNKVRLTHSWPISTHTYSFSPAKHQTKSECHSIVWQVCCFMTNHTSATQSHNSAEPAESDITAKSFYSTSLSALYSFTSDPCRVRSYQSSSLNVSTGWQNVSRFSIVIKSSVAHQSLDLTTLRRSTLTFSASLHSKRERAAVVPEAWTIFTYF